MAYLHLPAVGLNRQNLGCNRLQSCGHFARLCRDLPSYPGDLVDGPLGSVQFDTRHPPHSYQRRNSRFSASSVSVPSPLGPDDVCRLARRVLAPAR